MAIFSKISGFMKSVLVATCVLFASNAAWAVDYTVAYNLNGGTAGTYAPTTATVGTSFRVSKATLSGYTFKGWRITGMESGTHYWGTSSGATNSFTGTSYDVISTSSSLYFKDLRSSAGTVTLTALFSVATCTAGNYWNTSNSACTICPTGSYCPGLTVYVGEQSGNPGLNSCGSGYTTATTGSTSITQCYYNNANPTASCASVNTITAITGIVTGGSYTANGPTYPSQMTCTMYKELDGTNSGCVPIDPGVCDVSGITCASGYTAAQEMDTSRLYLGNQLAASTNPTGYVAFSHAGILSSSGVSDSQKIRDGKSNDEFDIYYGGGIMIRGRAHCSATVGTSGTAGDYGPLNDLTTPSAQMGKNCWCKISKVKNSSGQWLPIFSKWVRDNTASYYSDQPTCEANCSMHCASIVLGGVYGEAGSGGTNYRDVFFNTDNFKEYTCSLAITLDPNGGTGGTTAVYPTSTGVYLDAGHSPSKLMSTSANPIATKPTKSGWTYLGHYSQNKSESSGAIKYITSGKYITSDGITAGTATTTPDTSWIAVWRQLCPAGQYYSKSTGAYETCPTNGYYCPGSQYVYSYTTSNRCISACNTDDYTGFVSLSGSTSVTQCYKSSTSSCATINPITIEHAESGAYASSGNVTCNTYRESSSGTSSCVAEPGVCDITGVTCSTGYHSVQTPSGSGLYFNNSLSSSTIPSGYVAVSNKGLVTYSGDGTNLRGDKSNNEFDVLYSTGQVIRGRAICSSSVSSPDTANGVPNPTIGDYGPLSTTTTPTTTAGQYCWCKVSKVKNAEGQWLPIFSKWVGARNDVFSSQSECESGCAQQCAGVAFYGVLNDGNEEGTNYRAAIFNDSNRKEYTCTVDTTSVSFALNGGTGSQPGSITATFGAAMPTISTTPPTRTGYTLMGWYDNATYLSGTKYYNADGTSARTWNKANTENSTLYAGWSLNTYTINLNFTTNGGTGGATSIKEVYNTRWTDSTGTQIPGNPATIPASDLPTKGSGANSSVFKGYFAASSGGSAIIPATGVLPATTTFNDSNLTHTLYAQFEACTCTKRTGGHVASCTVTGVSDNKCQYTYTCETGYDVSGGTTTIQTATFEGAAATGSNTTPVNGCSGNHIGFSFASLHGGDNPTDVTGCTYGNGFTAPGAVSAPGYNFNKWLTNGTTTTQIAAGGTNVPCTVEVLGVTQGTATWTADMSPVQTTVSFDLNSGTAPSGVTYSDVTATFDDSMPAISTTPPTRKGYTFMGWYDNKPYTNSSAKQYYTADGASARNWDKTATESTLYAGWQAKTATISFDVNGGTGGPSGTLTATYAKAMPTITTAAPTRTGYIFMGWYYGSTQYYTAEQASALNWYRTGSAYTLKAQWEPIISGLITLDKNGGDTISPTGVYSRYGVGVYETYEDATNNTNALQTLTTVPKKANYRLKGLYNASSGGTPVALYNNGALGFIGTAYIAVSTADATATWYAQYNPVHKITFDKQDGTGGTNSIYTDHLEGFFANSYGTGDAVETITVPTRDGYSFKGYYASASDTTQFVDSNGSILSAFWQYAQTQSSNFTVYAQWQGNPITIHWTGVAAGANFDGTAAVVDANGNADSTVTYGGDIITPSAYVQRTGLKFLGWKFSATN